MAVVVTKVITCSEEEADEGQFSHFTQLWGCSLKNGNLQEEKAQK